VTLFPRRHVWVSEWRDTAHLRATMHSSFHIPIYCRELPYLDGAPVVDGAISMGRRHLAHGQETLAISAACWSGRSASGFADISSFLWPWETLLPPATEAHLEGLVASGREMARECLRADPDPSRRKCRGRVFRYGGAFVTIAMWGLRSVEEHILPSRVRRTPILRSSL